MDRQASLRARPIAFDDEPITRRHVDHKATAY
jgi:hypothetical protein